MPPVPQWLPPRTTKVYVPCRIRSDQVWFILFFKCYSLDMSCWPISCFLILMWQKGPGITYGPVRILIVKQSGWVWNSQCGRRCGKNLWSLGQPDASTCFNRTSMGWWWICIEGDTAIACGMPLLSFIYECAKTICFISDNQLSNPQH